MGWRFAVGVILYAALVWYGLKPFYVTFLAADRARWSEMLSKFPDRRAPGYVELLGEADARIPRGARVAIVFPTLDWPRGYSYAYYRAQYLLAGRVVVPLSWFDGPRPGRIGEAEYVVAYRAPLPPGEWEPLRQTADGTVARRRR